MLGQAVEGYDVEMTSSVLPKSKITGEIWAAPGLPTPPSPGYIDGTAAAFQSQMSKIKGMPLVYKVLYQNTPAGDIKVVSYATAIKQDQLTAEVFTIPSDFHKAATRMATKTPSAGFPLGDGMPLDSMNAVTSAMATGDGSDSSASGLLGGAGGGSGDMSQMLSGMSPEQMQQILGAAGAMNGGSGGGSGGAGDISSMMNPQMLQQLSGQLQSLMSDD